MDEREAIVTALAGLREGMVADGYDLVTESVAGGSVRVRVTAGPDACAECLVPKSIMAEMVRASLQSLPDVVSVEVLYADD